MTTERALLAFAGTMILISLALTYYVHANFVWLTAFVGVNMLQSAFTGFCPAVMVMRKVFDMQSEAEKATGQRCKTV